MKTDRVIIEPTAPRLELRCASDIPMSAIRWLWPGWLARGKFHLLAGPPGVAKTTIAMHFAAIVSAGLDFPDGTFSKAGNVLIWSGEDDPADTLVPRLRAAGADLNRVYFVGDMSAGDAFRSFDPATDIPALLEQAIRIGGVSLIVVDPIVSAVAGDSHKNGEVRRALQPLVDMADRIGAAVVGITHFSKGTTGRDPTERVTGSVAFGALARVVMVAAKASGGEHGSERILARAKSNVGPDGGGFGYTVEQVDAGDGIEASRISWGATLDGTAHELLGRADAASEAKDADEAAAFLRALISSGVQESKTIFREAESAGLSHDQIKRAKVRIGAKAFKVSMDGGWIWKLPQFEGSAQEAEGSTQNRPLPSTPSPRRSLRASRVDTSERPA